MNLPQKNTYMKLSGKHAKSKLETLITINGLPQQNNTHKAVDLIVEELRMRFDQNGMETAPPRDHHDRQKGM